MLRIRVGRVLLTPKSTAFLLLFHNYRYHIGLAYQVVDDILDITGSSDVLGKPSMIDMRRGLVTAPLL